MRPFFRIFLWSIGDTTIFFKDIVKKVFKVICFLNPIYSIYANSIIDSIVIYICTFYILELRLLYDLRNIFYIIY